MFNKKKRLVKSFILFISLIVLSLTFTFYSLSVGYQKLILPCELCADEENISVINILKWPDGNASPFSALKNGKQSFLDRRCKYKNCYITGEVTHLKNITDFDVIIFNGELLTFNPKSLPQQRSLRQKYIYVATESSVQYPVCCDSFDGYFNLTFTYRMDSDIHWRYVSVYDLKGNVVGPKIDMIWPERMDPITNELAEILKTKSIAASWFVSNCGENDRSGRLRFVKKLQITLLKYNLSIDIYGGCGRYKCSRKHELLCFEKVKKHYYFYLAFENSCASDYVTEKLITALNNYAVPIVYGAANYSRFLPPGSYLHASKLGVERLAKAMSDIINNKTLYHHFFRWRNHFKYKHTLDDSVCNLCEVLNDKQKMKSVTIVNNLRSWWNNGTAAVDACRGLK